MAGVPDHRRCMMHGDYAQAERLLESALASGTDPGPLHLDAVRLYHALNEPEKAASHLGRARELGTRHGVREPSLRLAEAVDHLAHGDARAASELLVLFTRDSEILQSPQEQHEAWVLAAEADLALGNAFRAWKSAERAAQGPGSREQPDLVTRAQLVLARCHLAK